MSHLPLLAELGLSPNEGKIYEALMSYGGSGVSTISLRAKVHRRNAYDALHRLIEKGLVYEIFSQGETMYEAVEPGKLMELIREKEMKLSSAMPEMLTAFQTHRSPQAAYMYRGIEGIKNIMREMLKTGEDVFIFGAEGAWFDPRLETHTHWFLREAKRKKMKLSIIFDWEVAEEFPQAPDMLTNTYKFLPKEYSTDSTMHIFGGNVVTYNGAAPRNMQDDTTIFVMTSPALAESYRIWWRYLWDSLPDPKGIAKKKRK